MLSPELVRGQSLIGRRPGAQALNLRPPTTGVGSEPSSKGPTERRPLSRANQPYAYQPLAAGEPEAGENGRRLPKPHPHQTADGKTRRNTVGRHPHGAKGGPLSDMSRNTETASQSRGDASETSGRRRRAHCESALLPTDLWPQRNSSRLSDVYRKPETASQNRGDGSAGANDEGRWTSAIPAQHHGALALISLG